MTMGQYILISLLAFFVIVGMTLRASQKNSGMRLITCLIGIFVCTTTLTIYSNRYTIKVESYKAIYLTELSSVNRAAFYCPVDDAIYRSSDYDVVTHPKDVKACRIVRYPKDAWYDNKPVYKPIFLQYESP